MTIKARLCLMVVCSIFTTGAAARGQQPVAEFSGTGQTLFVEDDLRELVRIYKLGPEQRTAAEILLRSGTERVQKAYMALMSKSPWTRQTDEQIPQDAEEQAAYYAKQAADWQRSSVLSGREAAAVEREVLRDVASLLDKDQAAKGWGEFDRFRRRTLVQGQAWYWFGCDPELVLKAAKVSEADSQAAAPILARHGERVDEMLIQNTNALRRINDEIVSSGKVDPQAWTRPELKYGEIRRLNVRTIRELEGVISEEGVAAVRRQRVGTEMSNYFQPPDRDQAVAVVLAVPTLSKEQKDRMQRLVDEAEDDVMGMATEALKMQDDLVLRGEEVAVVAERMREPQKKAARRLAALAKDLRGQLSEEQRAGLDSGGVTEETVDQLFKQKRALVPEMIWKARGGGARKPVRPEP